VGEGEGGIVVSGLVQGYGPAELNWLVIALLVGPRLLSII
jgi:hypothetical protein